MPNGLPCAVTNQWMYPYANTGSIAADTTSIGSVEDGRLLLAVWRSPGQHKLTVVDRDHAALLLPLPKDFLCRPQAVVVLIFEQHDLVLPFSTWVVAEPRVVDVPWPVVGARL